MKRMLLAGSFSVTDSIIGFYKIFFLKERQYVFQCEHETLYKTINAILYAVSFLPNSIKHIGQVVSSFETKPASNRCS